jgi:hypothetical protein
MSFIPFESTFVYQVIIDITSLNHTSLTECASELRRHYENDLESSFPQECLHYQAHLVACSETALTPLQLCQRGKQTELQNVYPNVDIALRMFLCTSVSNCTAERSLSCLKRIKTYLRSSLANERLNSLALMSIEPDLLLSLTYDDIIDDFANNQSRRKAF